MALAFMGLEHIGEAAASFLEAAEAEFAGQQSY
jgi:hypothetical protein